MTFDQLEAAVAARNPPSDEEPVLIRAMWCVATGDWARAHALAQEVETPDGAWVHAYLHRHEGDVDNAGYWYRRAGRPVSRGDLDLEWLEIASALTAE